MIFGGLKGRGLRDMYGAKYSLRDAAITYRHLRHGDEQAQPTHRAHTETKMYPPSPSNRLGLPLHETGAIQCVPVTRNIGKEDDVFVLCSSVWNNLRQTLEQFEADPGTI